ncbi:MULTISPECIES: SdpI family protein [unclassified Agrococcus]|uniref:SdpI family protein n=1 Tax=unclassified Agrococcus TaxID=2615065 RepID=UPI003612AA03
MLAVVLASGLLLRWMAGAAASGRLGRDPIAGIRTRATLASDAAWRAAHRRADGLTRAAGWCSIGAGATALVPLPMSVVIAVVLLGTTGMIVLALRAAVVGRHAARAADGD